MYPIFLDVESTGLDVNKDRLIQLAYKHRGTGEVVNELFKPPLSIPYESMAVHHITEEMVVDKPFFDGSDAQKKLLADLEGNILVAHNAPYDMAILANDNVVVDWFIDTRRVAQHLLPDHKSHKLQVLRYALHMNIEGMAHDALGDVLVLEGLYDHLLGILKEKGIEGDSAIEEMERLTHEPVMLQTFMFGKYAGKSFEEVSESDMGYLQWLHGSETQKPEADQNEDLVHTLEVHLGLKVLEDSSDAEEDVTDNQATLF